MGTVSATPQARQLFFPAHRSWYWWASLIFHSLHDLAAVVSYHSCVFFKEYKQTNVYYKPFLLSTSAGHTSHKSDCDELRWHRHHHSVLCATGRRRQVAAPRWMKMVFSKMPLRLTTGIQMLSSTCWHHPAQCHTCRVPAVREGAAEGTLVLQRGRCTSWSCASYK